MEIKVDGLPPYWLGFATSYLHRHCTDDPCWRDANCKLVPNHTVRFYNVMRVEWEDGIAYRKGIGKVWKDDWEQEQKEDVNVLLG